MYASSTTCELCASNTWSSYTGATHCDACEVGKRSTPSRTDCAGCPTINRTRLVFAQYFEPGCALRCAPGVSYLRTNALLPDGCGNCSTISVPFGQYLPTPNVSCVKTAPCTNRPSVTRSVYTGASKTPGQSLCPWECVPGFAGDLNCGACDSAGFDPRVQRWLYGCTAGCLPKRYAANCSRACVDLLSEYEEGGTLALRASQMRSERPYYVQGVCGTSEALGVAQLPALRRGRWAYRLESASELTLAIQGRLCGDAFLNVGEACDDGNAVSGDGCSDRCVVETNAYWDCDLVGAPCLPDCGWPRAASPWGLRLSAYGYVLPKCKNGVCVCDALRYNDVQALPSLANRTAWMAQNLIPCDCDGNPHRTLPYAECTVDNRGCRMCAAGEYHYDQYARCVPCGSECAVGYTRADPMVAECGPGVATSALLALSAETQRQRAVGCVSCPASTLLPGMRFLGNGTCDVACTRNEALLTSGYTVDRYCSAPVDARTGACRGQCVECALWLSALRPVLVGKYPQGCVDVYGYRWVDCEGLPPNAHWTLGTLMPNAARGCAWACDACAWTLASHSACLPCGLKGKVPCASGSRLIACSDLSCPLGAEYEVCVPCDGLLPREMQAWTSDPPFYTQCLPDCEPGLSFSAQRGDECTACTRVVCALGNELVPCVPRSDATCRNCTLRPANSEFVTEGSCETRCATGYHRDAASGECVACDRLVCATGSRRSSECVAVEERLQAPTCVECEGGPPPEGMRWEGCAMVCVSGYVRLSSGECVPCAPALCGLGYRGVCVDSRLVCSACEQTLSGARWAAPGDCASMVCLDGYTLQSGVCVPPPQASTTPTPPALVPKGASVTRGLPVRTVRHS